MVNDTLISFDKLKKTVFSIIETLRATQFYYLTRFNTKTTQLRPFPQSPTSDLSIADASSFNFLSPDEVTAVLNTLKQLSPFCEKRNRILTTLGTAAYSDGLENPDGSIYKEKVKKLNPLLQEHFGWIYTRLLEFFNKNLPPGCQAKYHPELSLPGFHIFDFANKGDVLAITHIHTDQQFKPATKIAGISGFNPETTLSFTLSIKQPTGGTGILFFDHLSISNKLNFLPDRIRYFLMKKYYIPYKPGVLITQNGNLLHTIATPVVSSMGPETRITIQGHGIYVPNERTWYLYW